MPKTSCASAQEFHLGERTGYFAQRPGDAGTFPRPLENASQSSGWRAGDTANLCIGQGEVDVTPMQMAVLTAAIANGGTVLWPRLVERIEPQDPATSEAATNFPAGVVRDRLTVHPRTLNILRNAMLDDVDRAPKARAGTQRSPACTSAAKTGTAQVQDEHNRLIGHNYWFASFAPYESPKYAVVVLVQSATEGGSGGGTCGPIAHDIYETIVKKEAAPKAGGAGKKLNEPADTFNEHRAASWTSCNAGGRCSGLMVIGALFVYSATMSNGVRKRRKLWYAQIWFRQVIWYGLGLGAAAALCSVSYHTLARWSFVFYWAMIICLVAVLVPFIGKTHGWGARRWIDLPFYQFQPSEFAKIAFVLAGANFLSRPPEELRHADVFWKGIGMIMLPFMLIMKEPDLGSALVLVPTGLMMMLVAGTPQRYLLRLVGVVGVLGALFVADVLFAPPLADQDAGVPAATVAGVFREGFCVPAKNATEETGTPGSASCKEEQLKSSFNGQQAMISVGSGGLWGAGWGKGKQTSLQFMPSGSAHNDFIFSPSLPRRKDSSAPLWC